MQMQSVFYFDHYLCRPLRTKQLDIIMHPCELVRAALWFDALRSHNDPRQQPLPFPSCIMRFTFWPLQPQRFMVGCVAATVSRRLVTPPHRLFADPRTMSQFAKYVLFRVMRGFISRVEVRPRRFTCLRRVTPGNYFAQVPACCQTCLGDTFCSKRMLTIWYAEHQSSRFSHT